MQRRSYLRLLWLQAIALWSRPAQAASWSYQGETGAEFWGQIKPEFQICNAGQAQSPIDLTPEMATIAPGNLELNYQDTTLAVVSNRRTLRIDYQPGSSLTLDGEIYELLQFHFHHPSEHTLRGQRAPMEAHLVHRNPLTQKLLVLAVLMQEGATNNLISRIWSQTNPSGQNATTASDLIINALQLLPENSHQYYRYQGSLTTPPCSETVTWLVFKQPVTLSRKQIDRFFSLVGYNARPIQAWNHRSLMEFD